MRINLIGGRGAASRKVTQSGARNAAKFSEGAIAVRSALTGLEAALGLINDVDAALSPYQTVVAVAATQGFQRIADFHRKLSLELGR